MKIGVVKERAPNERRVALVPESCKKLIQAGYEISVEAGAGVHGTQVRAPTVCAPVLVHELPELLGGVGELEGGHVLRHAPESDTASDR